MTASIIIPLDCLTRNEKTQSRCYASKHLVEVLERIAGKGDKMLWWTEDEVHRALSLKGCDWAWCPHGPTDPMVNSFYSNCQTHMKIFFKNPAHAVLFKLTWL